MNLPDHASGGAELPKRAEIESALERLLDGEPEPADGPLLTRAMQAHPALRRELSGLLAIDELLRQNAAVSPSDFLDAVRERIAAGDDTSFVDRLHDTLRAAPRSETAAPAPQIGRRPKRLVAASLVAASLLIVATALGYYLLRPTSAPQPEVATLLLAEQCQWTGARSVDEGNRLSAGPLGLERGLAVLRFDGGAELILRDATEVELLSAGRARLVRGEVTVRATDDAAGFKLLTPAGEVIDLGTEFAARAEASGATELHVLEGDVAFSKEASRRPDEVLHAGKAIRFDDATAGPPREVALRADRFDAIVRAAHPASRADLMTAYEGFAYPSGRAPFPSAAGGIGWRAPWRGASAAEAYRPVEDAVSALDIASADARPAWSQPGADPAGALDLPLGTTSLVRPLERPIDLSRDGVYYFSCVVREPDSEAGLIDRRYGGVRFVLRSSTNPDDMLSFGPSRIRRPGIRLGGGANFTSPIQIARNQTTLWIGKIIARRSGDDEIFFSVYSDGELPGYAEPSVWQVATRNVRRSGTLDLVLLAGQLSKPTTLDEIRLGPTWRSVAPIAPPPDAPTP